MCSSSICCLKMLSFIYLTLFLIDNKNEMILPIFACKPSLRTACLKKQPLEYKLSL